MRLWAFIVVAAALVPCLMARNNRTKRQSCSIPRPGAPATACDPSCCRLPACSCGGKDIPGGLRPDETPQFVLMTWDDAVNDLNREFFKDLHAPSRVNPNGCPIKSTFYISHEWSDYSQIQDLYADGHEIASHTISHKEGSRFDETQWAEEVIGEAELLVNFAGVDPRDIKGMRAPFLAVGGDTMFNTLNRYGLVYDSSMSTSTPAWPYTLEYKMPHSCAVSPCPKNVHPGMWEVPMKTLKDIRGGSCSMADGCFYEENIDSIQKIFTKNFLEHYTSSKAPFPLFFHAAWFFNRNHRKTAFLQFIDSILALPDVYFVTSQELIEWTKNPVPISQMAQSPIFHCNFPNRPGKCGRKKKKCQLNFKGDKRQFSTCQSECPRVYPWVNNLVGQ